MSVIFPAAIFFPSHHNVFKRTGVHQNCIDLRGRNFSVMFVHSLAWQCLLGVQLCYAEIWSGWVVELLELCLYALMFIFFLCCYTCACMHCWSCAFIVFRSYDRTLLRLVMLWWLAAVYATLAITNWFAGCRFNLLFAPEDGRGWKFEHEYENERKQSPNLYPAERALLAWWSLSFQDLIDVANGTYSATSLLWWYGLWKFSDKLLIATMKAQKGCCNCRICYIPASTPGTEKRHLCYHIPLQMTRPWPANTCFMHTSTM